MLEEDISNDLKEILWKTSKNFNYDIKALEVMPDHVDLFISTKPTVSPMDIVRTLKSISAIELFKLHPRLNSFYSRADSLWSKGYFASTVGNVSEDMVKKYIENQKKNN